MKKKRPTKKALKNKYNLSKAPKKTFAESELERAGLLGPKAPYGGDLATAVLELLEVFHRQGHSGMSASVVIQVFTELAMGRPLTPLTGDESEWTPPESDGTRQNKRYPAVFKDKKGVYFLNAIKFIEPSGFSYYGSAYTSSGLRIYSHQYFKPPLLPKTFLVHVDAHNNIIDGRELIPVFEIYIKPDDYNNPNIGPGRIVYPH
jgi:hypothetical protein